MQMWRFRKVVKGGEDEEHDSSQLDTLSHELKGNALLVYWYMLRRNKPYSSREIQRGVGISSASLALHHLNKLIELGLVSTDDEGRYVAAKKVKPGLLSLFMGSGRLFIPRFVFYSMFTTTVLISCVYLFWPFPTAESVLLIIMLLIVSTVFWIESFKLWKMQPV